MTHAPLVTVSDLRKSFAIRGGLMRRVRDELRAVDGVSFDIAQGETLGLVGESGCGKSTLARCVARLAEPTSGSVRFAGDEIAHLTSRRLRPLRRSIQLIFQDPMASLNPRKRVGTTLRDALRFQGIAGIRARETSRIGTLLEQVGLAPSYADRMPRELSGGQRQRVVIARALAVEPRFIVADEPVSALDVSVQAQILNLLKDLKDTLGLTMLFISHDLGVVRHVSDRIGVMYLGKLVELAPADALYETPLHPYSRALLAAVPLPDPDARGHHGNVIEGDIPTPLNPPRGCRFHTRCPLAQEICVKTEPALTAHANGHFAACHFASAEHGVEATSRAVN
ncbi:MAG: ABC transporter ATP-binding protein [Rhizobiaceae bacterium]